MSEIITTPVHIVNRATGESRYTTKTSNSELFTVPVYMEQNPRTSVLIRSITVSGEIKGAYITANGVKIGTFINVDGNWVFSRPLLPFVSFLHSHGIHIQWDNPTEYNITFEYVALSMEESKRLMNNKLIVFTSIDDRPGCYCIYNGCVTLNS
jgi:hypothetical protein